MVAIDLTAVALVADEYPLVAFRVARCDGGAIEVIDSLKSNRELGKAPKGLEITYPKLHEGISAYTTVDAAVENAQKWPKLGKHVVKLELDGSSGASFLAWGARGHLTIWCDSLILSKHVTDTIVVDEVTPWTS